MKLSRESKKRKGRLSKLLTNTDKKCWRMRKASDIRMQISRKPWKWNCSLSNKKRTKLNNFNMSMSRNSVKCLISNLNWRRTWQRSCQTLKLITSGNSKTKTLNFTGGHWLLKKMKTESNLGVRGLQRVKREMQSFYKKLAIWEKNWTN